MAETNRCLHYIWTSPSPISFINLQRNLGKTYSSTHIKTQLFCLTQSIQSEYDRQRYKDNTSVFLLNTKWMLLKRRAFMSDPQRSDWYKIVCQCVCLGDSLYHRTFFFHSLRYLVEMWLFILSARTDNPGKSHNLSINWLLMWLKNEYLHECSVTFAWVNHRKTMKNKEGLEFKHNIFTDWIPPQTLTDKVSLFFPITA